MPAFEYQVIDRDGKIRGGQMEALQEEFLRRDLAQQGLFVVNLEPRKMRGVMSEGMLFDIGYADGIKPALAFPETEVPNGARAG